MKLKILGTTFSFGLCALAISLSVAAAPMPGIPGTVVASERISLAHEQQYHPSSSVIAEPPGVDSDFHISSPGRVENEGQDRVTLKVRGLLPPLSDASIAAIMQEMANSKTSAHAVEADPSSSSDFNSELAITHVAASPTTVDPLEADLQRKWQQTMRRRLSNRRWYEKNKRVINLQVKLNRELQTAVNPAPTRRQLKARQYSARYRKREKVRVELEAVLNPGERKPLTKVQLRRRRQYLRQKERKAAVKAAQESASQIEDPVNTEFTSKQNEGQLTSASQQEVQQKLIELEELLGLQ